MTPVQQKQASEYLTYVKQYLDWVTSHCSDEDFAPELAGMVERVGVILSAVKAGYYTTIVTPALAANGGIRLTKDTIAHDGYSGTDYNYKIVGTWKCVICQHYFNAGDVVDKLTPDLRHIDCNRPQG